MTEQQEEEGGGSRRKRQLEVKKACVLHSCACPRIPAARESPQPLCSSRHLHVASRDEPKNRNLPCCASSATNAAIYSFLNSNRIMY